MQAVQMPGECRFGTQYALVSVLSCRFIWTPIFRIGKEREGTNSEERIFIFFFDVLIIWDGENGPSDLAINNQLSNNLKGESNEKLSDEYLAR
jgi:hypothetical protein